MEEEFNEETFEDAIKLQKDLAQRIWDKPFFEGLSKMSKSELILIINRLIEELDLQVNLHGDPNYDERDWKDLLFDQKCLLIETLHDKFFKEEN